MISRLPTDLQQTLDAFNCGTLTKAQAIERIKAKPAFSPADLAARAWVLRVLASQSNFRNGDEK